MKPDAAQLVIATGNAGKIGELKRLFAVLPVTLKSLNDFEGVSEVEETGSTFRANAELKAAGYARQTGMRTLADDSGLEVEALGGAPGVLSARYQCDSGFDVKIEKLLEEIAETGSQNRSARFVCAMSVADSSGNIELTTEGICEGSLALEPWGTKGFGYDPIFVPTGFDRSFGELDDDVKQQISHRGRAAAIIIRYLLDKKAV